MNRRLGATGTMALVILAAACGGSDDDAGAPAGTPSKVLVSSSPTPADATCPGGGTKLDFGVDLNGNGTLDPDEISATQVVCKPEPGAPVTLTTVTPSGPSDKCKNGGTTVKSGADTNKNGKLDADEVTQTDEICGGGSSAQLAKTTPLAEGDPLCPFGGSVSAVGIDNGKGGGVAGDGVLQDGEVVTSFVSCPTGLPFPGTFAPPPGAAGTSKILVSGGEGTDGAGGEGGGVDIGYVQGTLGGNVAIFKTGKVDADFVLKAPTPSFGTTKLDVAADLILEEHANDTEAAVGEYYVIGSELLYKKSDAEPKVPVTGIHVAAGVTLTFPGGTVDNLTHDVQNEGTITTPLASGDRAPLSLVMQGRYISTAASKLALAGGPVAGASGGSGASLDISAQAIFADGTIDTSGANGDGAGDGGDGGRVLLLADGLHAGPLELGGTIKTTGGAATGSGGDGGTVIAVVNERGLRSNAVIDQSGGKGAGGGDGGYLVFDTYVSELVVAGSRTSKGGEVDAAACATTCAGGSGGGLQAQAFGGNLTWSADNLAASASSKGTDGPDGPEFLILGGDGEDSSAAGNVRVSGTLDVRGGSGTTGGAGGSAAIVVETDSPRGQEVLLYGYETVDLRGGAGITAGGEGGSMSAGSLEEPETPCGSTINYATLVANGGAATAGPGGDGGRVFFGNGILGVPTPGSRAIVSAGAIDVSGGDGVSGGDADRARFLTDGRVDLLGAVTEKGGNASGDGAKGGAVPPFQIHASVGLTIGAPITLAGGDGTGAAGVGGACAGIELHSEAVSATAGLTCGGGKGNGAAGGAGGDIDIASSAAASSLMSVTAPGGTGTPNGADGTIVIDGIEQ